MSEVIASRVLSDRIDVRDSSEGRTVYGIVVPYGVVAEVNDGAGPYRESFRMGAFKRSIEQQGHKVKLMTNHDGSKLPAGRATLLEERREGLYGEFLVSRNRTDLLADVDDGIIDSFSVGFRGIRHERTDGVTVRTEAHLREVSLVGFPAYTDARVAGVRSDIPDDVRVYLDRYVSDLLALADPGTGTPTPPNGHGRAAVRAAQLRSLDLITQDLKGRS